ncbi:MAG: aldose 1-epimerase [Myxococcales bacterium FL481]|nr:MAG: aldose 1-epimerase [Myxococcales bacterium FL481]
MLELQTDHLRLGIDPGIGASVRNLDVKLEGQWTPLWYPAPDRFSDLRTPACYVLAPYSGRVRDGKFEYNGQPVTLASPEHHAIHGHVRNRPWSLVERSAASCKLRFLSSAFSDMDFPFPFVVELEYRLSGAQLRIELKLFNIGTASMPAGAGLHPYFARTLTDPQERATLQFACQGVYPSEDVPIPTGPAQAVPPDWDFSSAREIDVELDHCFAGWDGRAAIRWPGSGLTATLEASDTCEHVVVYAPADQPFFAFEPVTHVNDAVNLLTRGVEGHGLVDLAPRDHLSYAMTLKLEGERLG